ncbi:MAG: sporulation initiation factor Spo0A C-terminal domain-containing protein [Clostridia bacterium]
MKRINIQFTEDVVELIISFENLPKTAELKLEDSHTIKVTSKGINFQNNKREEIYLYKTKEILKRIGMFSSSFGYRNICEAILQIAADEQIIHNIIKGLYTNIAIVCNSTPSKVERSIRHSKEEVFNNPNQYELEKIFSKNFNFKNGKPTNGQFLSILYEYVSANIRNN